MKNSFTRRLLLCIVPIALSAAVRADISVYNPRASVDPSAVSIEAVQKSLGRTPEALFTYVRDHVRYLPYPGLMQGARGTLLSLSGNALDQSLLLVALLTSAGHEARLVTGSLDRAQTETLVKAAFVWRYGDSGQRPAWAEELAQEIKAQLDVILGAMKANGSVRLPLDAQAEEAARVMDILRTHWWVQWHRDGSWVDLDPSFPDAAPGRAVGRNARAGSVPDELHHKLTVRVKVKEQVGRDKKDRVLLVQTFPTADLMGEPIYLTHQSETWKGPGSPAALAAGTLDALVGGDPDNYLPVLTVGRKDWKGATFYPEGKKGRATGLSALTAALSPDTLLLTQWVELELSSPLGQRTGRYDIFDRTKFGSDNVTKGDLGLDHPGRSLLGISLSAGPLEHATAQVNRAASTINHSGGAQGAYTDMSIALGTIAQTVAMLTDRLVQRLDDDDLGRVTYVPLTPRIVVLDSRHDGEQAAFSIDLRHAHYLPLGDSEVLQKNRFLLQVVKGVVDGVVENYLLELLFSPPSQKFARRAESTALVFETARKNRIDAQLVTKPDAVPATAARPGEAQRRLAADLAQGYWVVVPKQPVNLAGAHRTAWWRIDPATGQTVGVTQEGLHGAFTEYKVMLDRNTLAIRQIWVKHAGTAHWTRMDRAGWAAVWANRAYLKMRGLLTVHIFKGGI
jgi:hypothetical protein